MNIILNFDRVYIPPEGSAVNLDLGTPPGEPVPDPEWNGLRKEYAIPWQATTARLARETRIAWQATDAQLAREVALRWEAAAGPLMHGVDLPWQAAAPLAHALRLPWDSAQRLGREIRIPWKNATQIARGVRITWKNAIQLTRAWRLPWQAGAPVARAWRLAWDGAAPLYRATRIPWASPPLQRVAVRIPWEQGQPPPFVWPPPAPYVPPVPDPRVYIPPLGGAVVLDFACPIERYLGGVPLAFREFACSPRAPYLRTYVIMNSVELVRLPDRAPVAAASVDIGADLDSWTWDFAAKLRSQAALDMVKPGGGGPVAVEATINGHVFVALVETWAETRRHGYSEWTVRGRSQSATLADPYTPATSYTSGSALTAHQLADGEMPPTGWILDWQAPDWLVPAGAYSYRDKTAVAALQHIAEAIGAVVQSHQTDATLIIAPRYPLSPWDWAAATPAVTVTQDILRGLATDWRPRPAYDGVYVMGESQGVSVFVKRTGSAGATLAGMVTHPLITHVDAGRERGRNILAAAGAWSVETIEMPLMVSPAAPGLLLPGVLIEVDDGVTTWRGQVLSVRVSAQRSDGPNGGTVIWQTVEVERWYG